MDLRRLCLRALLGRVPVDEREAVSVAAALDALERLPAPFDQAAGPVHVTGSGVVTGGRGVLLLRHRRLGIWVQPGGHLDPGETPWAAARREGEEETGMALALGEPGGGVPSLLHVDVHPGGRGHTHIDLRYGLVVADADDRPRPPPRESQDIAWFSWSDAIATADPGLRGLLVALSPATDG